MPAKPHTPRQPEPVPSEHFLTARFLRAHRVSQGLSQGALAKRAHVSQVSISRLECGHRAQLRNLVKLSRALGVTVQALRAVDSLAEVAPTTVPLSSAA
jgi:transcriptional regulator with XRE-family HTH domain